MADDDRSSRLVASLNGHERVVKLLLDRGALIEGKSYDGQSPLLAASYNGHERVVELLLNKGANIESKSVDGRSPLWIASCNGHKKVVKLLLDRDAMIESKSDDGGSPLWTASSKGHKSVVKLLLDRGAMIESKSDDARSPLWTASFNGHQIVVKLLLDKGAMIESKTDDGRYPLQVASYNGHESVVNLLLDRGAMIENKSDVGCSPLWIASWNGQERVVKLFLDRGAMIESKSDDGRTPLLVASWNGHDSVVKLLLDRGAMVEAKDVREQSPLYAAAVSGHKKVVETLLQHGANIESKDNKGKSPFNQAATVGHTEIIEVLLEHGADSESKDDDGLSPWDNCLIHGQINVVRYFLKGITDKTDLRTDIEEWLLLAARHGQKDIITFLVNRNKTPCLDFLGLNGQSPLATAISNSQFECVRMLTSWGASLSFIDDIKLVQCLSQSGSIDIYKYLLIAGLNQNAVDSSGQKSHQYLAFSEDIAWDIFRMALSPHEVKERESFSTSSLVTFPGVGSVMSLDNHKLNELKQTIDTKIKRILYHNNYILHLTGGVAESTKVGFPDEFDYVVLNKVHLYNLPKNITDVGHGYRRTDNVGLFDSSKILHSRIWAYIDSSDDMIISIPSAVAGGGSASTVVQIRWKDEQCSLVVSIDVVPVLQVKGWPDDAIKKTWKMGYKDLEKWGYHLVVRPPHQDSSFGKTFREAERERLYRVTFSVLEVEHIKDLPDKVKNAYILAKCLRDPVVCQVVVRDDGIRHFVDKFLTSYLLKTVFMHNVDDFLRHERPLVEMAYILYSQLEYYLSLGSIPLFWMPKINLLQGVNINVAKSHKVAAHMKAYVGELYHDELTQEPPGDVNSNLGIPPDCLVVDPKEASALEILALPLKQERT